MNKESEKIIDKYLATNHVTRVLSSSDLDLLKKLLYNFTQTKGDLLEVSVLLAFCTKTLRGKDTFTKDMAKISYRALELIFKS